MSRRSLRTLCADQTRRALRCALSTARAACASFRPLPLGPPAPGPSRFSLRLEQTRMGLFHSVRDDASIDRVFVGPGDSFLLVTSTDPQTGVYSSPDSGRAW